ncbi:hypothetical protein LIA77_04064 [Sarocladium implicatum]|nr:hypothetical protein LIA77_04064 [Sarocladium implicatum]
MLLKVMQQCCKGDNDRTRDHGMGDSMLLKSVSNLFISQGGSQSRQRSCRERSRGLCKNWCMELNGTTIALTLAGVRGFNTLNGHKSITRLYLSLNYTDCRFQKLLRSWSPKLPPNMPSDAHHGSCLPMI